MTPTPLGPGSPGPLRRAPVWGRDDLVCPLTDRAVRTLLRHAYDHPWRGNTPLTYPGHRADTTAILDPGRPTRLLLPVAPDFRWELGTDASRWYDSVTLVRQAREFDWPDVIARVREEIVRLAAAHRGDGGASAP